MSLACEQISFCYDPPSPRDERKGVVPHYAVRSLSFELHTGECLVLTGPTGSGKSTLIHLLSGLMQPTTGTITWRGKRLTSRKSLAQARTHLGVALQYPERQLFATTVFDDIAFGLRNAGFSEAETEQRIDASLAQVGLSPAFKDVSPFALSGGEQRRVALAGVLALRPEILILDEPTAGLDPQTHETFVQLLQNLHTQGITLVVASHDMDDIARLATRVLVLNQGGKSFLGSLEDLFVTHAHDLNSWGLALPCAQQCAQDLQEAGMPLPQKLYCFETLADQIAETLGSCAAHYESNERRSTK